MGLWLASVLSIPPLPFFSLSSQYINKTPAIKLFSFTPHPLASWSAGLGFFSCFIFFCYALPKRWSGIFRCVWKYV